MVKSDLASKTFPSFFLSFSLFFTFSLSRLACKDSPAHWRNTSPTDKSPKPEIQAMTSLGNSILGGFRALGLWIL